MDLPTLIGTHLIHLMDGYDTTVGHLLCILISDSKLLLRSLMGISCPNWYCIMGQAISSLWKTPPSIMPLLNLPVEVVLPISDQLTADPGALVALSPTCKPLYNMLKERATLHGVDRENLLLLLEKDFGDKVFYCPFCFRLHSFLSSSSPTEWDLRLYVDSPRLFL